MKHSSDFPHDPRKAALESIAAVAAQVRVGMPALTQVTQKVLELQEADRRRMGESIAASFRVRSERIRAEVQAQRDTHEILAEIKAARRFDWRALWINVLISAISLTVGWLLSSLNALQVLSGLLHH